MGKYLKKREKDRIEIGAFSRHATRVSVCTMPCDLAEAACARLRYVRPCSRVLILG